MIFEDEELLGEFVVESQEHLDEIESHLLALEELQDGVDIALVNKVFRSVHSIKGAAGFLGLGTLESLAHREEAVLDRLRNNELRPTRKVVGTLLSATDQLKELLAAVETSNEQDVTEHIDALNSVLNDGAPPGSIAHTERPAAEPARTASMPDAEPDTYENVANPQEHDAPFTKPAERFTRPATPAGDGVETTREFLVESYDWIEQVERDLVELERDPTNSDLIDSIFRSVHTIKRSTGFLGHQVLENLTLATEDLLGRVRSGRLQMNATVGGCLSSVVDQMRSVLEAIEATGSDAAANGEKILVRCMPDGCAPHVDASSCNQGRASCETQDATTCSSLYSDISEAKTKAHRLPPTTSHANVYPTGQNSTASLASHDVEPKRAADSTIRVDVALLDKLMTQVGELVLARNQIMQFTNSVADNAFESARQRLNWVANEIHDTVIKTRMQPIGAVWSKFPRIVRNLATSCGKQIRIEMEGRETELDKTIIEAIKDPLTHLVRNSVDHGIESVEARAAAGKPLEGCLSLRANCEEGQVNIEISDDGAGLQPDRIKAKAIHTGLITAEQADRMEDRDCAQLIFMPGFSTAETVSNVSGRGVGMDVVKTNIEKICGTVDIQSQQGRGATIRVKIPLTLATTPALIVLGGGNHFAIPQVNLLELVRLDKTHDAKSIEWIQGAPVYRLRGRLLPLVYLQNVLHTKDREPSVDSANIVVLRADDRQFGLIVDQIRDKEEIVVRPLSEQPTPPPVYAGACTLGDGNVAQILDVLEIANIAQVVPDAEGLGRLADQRPNLRSLA